MLVKLVFAILVTISLIGIAANATSASVTAIKVEAKYGILIYTYYLISSTVTTTTPSTNTALIPPTGTGTHTFLAISETAYLWSTQFPTATTISPGAWLLDLWASSVLGGTMTVSIYITNSAGTIQSTIVSSGTTSTIGETKGQVATTFIGSEVSVPANGYIEVEVTAPTLSVITMDWGAAQLTDFQVPKTVLS
jgi:hypothetical protein